MFRKMVEAEPNRFYNWYAYTEVLMLVGQYNKALETLQKAISLHKDRAEFYYQMSNVLFNLGKEEDAREYLATALVMEPSLAQDMLQKYPFIRDEVKG